MIVGFGIALIVLWADLRLGVFRVFALMLIGVLRWLLFIADCCLLGFEFGVLF